MNCIGETPHERVSNLLCVLEWSGDEAQHVGHTWWCADQRKYWRRRLSTSVGSTNRPSTAQKSGAPAILPAFSTA